MALADTAQLAVRLSLSESGFSAATAKVQGLEAAATRSGTSFGTLGVKASSAGSKIENALGHAKNQLMGVLGGVGMLAGGAGLLGLGAAFTSSVNKVEEFGASLEKVQTLTGETALASGALILDFQKFGMGADRITQIVGFTEKTLGKLNETMSGKGKDAVTKLTALDRQYGLQLVDSHGKVADFSTVLGQLASFYDSNASASTKAYVASQVFGRGYTAMIPILNEGSAGLRQAAADAASLGLASSDTVGQLAAFHDEAHALDNQINLLQLGIGTALLPSLIDLTTAATKFVGENRAGIANFFRDAAHFAGELGVAVRDVVLPAIGMIGSAWNSIPEPMRNLIIGGFIANKAIKWTFGIDVIGAVGPAILRGITGLFKNATTAAMSVEAGVVNVAGGGIPGVVGGGAGAAGGIGLVPGLGAVAAGAVIGGLVAEAIATPIVNAIDSSATSAAANAQFQQTYRNPYAQGYGTARTLAPGANNPFGTAPTVNAQTGFVTSGIGGMAQFGAVLKNGFTGMGEGLKSAIASAAGTTIVGLSRPLDALHIDFRQGLRDLVTATNRNDIRKAADRIAADIVKGVGNTKTTTSAVNQLKAAQAAAIRAGDKELAAALGKDINKVEAKLPNRRYVEGQYTAANQILGSNKTQAAKLAALERIQSDLRAHGDRTAAAHIQSLQNALERKKLTVTVNDPVTVNVNTTVSAADVKRATTVRARFQGVHAIQAR